MRNTDNNRNEHRGAPDKGTRGGTSARNASGTGDMSVREAGHLGGQRERELVQEGKQAEGSGHGHRNNDR